jgi:thiol-disulfide isomerase/thioredoxin
MRVALTAAFVLCAALASAGAGTDAAPQTRKGRAPARRTQRKPAAKPTPAPRPEVREIDEAGLKSLLEGRASKGRILLVNFWATWCVPCREEFPDLVRIEKEFRSRGEEFEFVTVSLDDATDIKTAVPDFLAEMRATRMPAYLLNAAEPDAAINLINPEWRGELPATFLFGRRGALFYKHMGRVKPAELRESINAALGQGYDEAPPPAATPTPTPTPEPTPTPTPTPEPTPPPGSQK